VPARGAGADMRTAQSTRIDDIHSGNYSPSVRPV
jgi:hypothetical protein